jgi:transcriptional regulator with AAA-type ATPase domain
VASSPAYLPSQRPIQLFRLPNGLLVPAQELPLRPRRQLFLPAITRLVYSCFHLKQKRFHFHPPLRLARLDDVVQLPQEVRVALRVDARVIAATNRNLEEAVRQGSFRSDLYYRFNIFPITVPPLRERREDIPELVTHLVKQFSSKMGKEIETIPQNAMTALQNYHWPGNIRELRNVIERAVIITQGATLRLTDDLGAQSLE